MDIAGLYDLLLYDVTAPLVPGPGGNPSLLSEDLVGSEVLSRELIAWVACTDAGTAPCDYSDPQSYGSDGWEIFVMPEAEAGLAAWLVLAALRVRRPRAKRPRGPSAIRI